MMEKYCPRCGRVLGQADFKFCPYCRTKLETRVGRQPIPGKLRHKVFVRDNYRCVECGATNKETTLEIDHIIPVSKGGTNDISNLQTLCRECNRAKSATIWNQQKHNSFNNNSYLKSITAKMREERNQANPKLLLENLSDWSFKKLCYNLSIKPLSKDTESINYLCKNFEAYSLQRSIKQVIKDEKYFSNKFLSNLDPLTRYGLSKRLLGKEKYDKDSLISELINKFSFDDLKKEVNISQSNVSFDDWINTLDEDELCYLLRQLYLTPENQSKECMIKNLTENCSEQDILSVFILLEENPTLKNDYKPIKIGNGILDNLSDSMINQLFNNLSEIGTKENFSKQQKLNYLSTFDKKLLKKSIKALNTK